MPRSSEEEEEEQEAGFKDNLKTAGGAVAFLVAFIGSGAYFFRSTFKSYKENVGLIILRLENNQNIA